MWYILKHRSVICISLKKLFFKIIFLQDEKVRCPMSGKVLKLKDLTDVHFTPIKDGDNKTALISKTVSVI